MFKKNDPMLDAVKGAMAKGDAQRKAIASVNEQFGVTSRRGLTLQQKAEYDVAIRKAVLGEAPNVINEEEEDLSESITKIWNKYHKNEDNNYHAENRVLLAKHFGTDEEHEDAKALYKQHMKQGSLPYGTPLYDKVTKANEGHWAKLKQAKANEDKAAQKALKPKEPGNRASELQSRVAKVNAIAKTVKTSAKKGNTYTTTYLAPDRNNKTMHDDGKREVLLKRDGDHALARVQKIKAKAQGELKNMKKQGKLFEQIDEASKEKLQRYIKKATDRQVSDGYKLNNDVGDVDKDKLNRRDAMIDRAKKLVKRAHLKVVKEGNNIDEMAKVHDWHSGAQLHPDDQKHVLGSYVHRYTKEHKPKWANEKRPDGREYQPHHATDADWLKHTKFAVKKDGRLDTRVRHSQSTPSLKLDEADLNELINESQGYSKSAVDKAIKGSRKKIGGKEAKMIHALLKGRQKEDEPTKKDMKEEVVAKGSTFHKDKQEWSVTPTKTYKFKTNNNARALNAAMKKIQREHPGHEGYEAKIKGIKEDSIAAIEEEISTSLKAKYDALQLEAAKEAFVNALSEEEYALLEKFFGGQVPGRAPAANPNAVATAQAAYKSSVTAAQDKAASNLSASDAGNYINQSRGALAGSNAPAAKPMIDVSKAPRPGSFAPRGAPTPQAPSPGTTLTGTSSTASAAPAPVTPAAAPRVNAAPGGGSMKNVNLPISRPTGRNAGQVPGGGSMANVSLDARVSKPATTPATTPATSNAAKRKPMQPANRNPVPRIDNPRPPMRKPVGPKRSFGYGGGGSGRDDAGSVTNRAFGAVNEEVAEKPAKRSLESILRERYGK